MYRRVIWTTSITTYQLLACYTTLFCNYVMLVVYPMHWIDPQISFSVGQSVCLLTDRLSNDYVHSSLPIFTKFCTRLRNLVASSHIVLRQTGSSLPSFGGVRVPIWQFSGSGDHIFNRSAPNRTCR